MQGDVGAFDALEFHFGEQEPAEVEAGGGGNDGSFLGGVDGLVVGLVARLDVAKALDVIGQRGGADLHQLPLEGVVVAVEEETQRAAPGGRVVDDLGHQAVVLGERELVADADFPCGIDQHVPQAALLVKLAQQENTDLGACLLFLTEHQRRENAGVVHHEQIAVLKIVNNVLK